MQYDSKQLSLIAAQAAHHLHAVVSHTATALIDVTPGKERILFSNSALSYINGSTLVDFARHYLSKGSSLHSQSHVDDLFLYFIVLDECHVFTIIGKPQDEFRIQEFSQRLERLLNDTIQPA